MAAQPIPIPKQPEKPDQPRGFTRTPTRFFTHVVPTHTYVESVCCGLILSRTVGWGRMWASIPSADFERVANCTGKAVADALWTLTEEGLIESKRMDGVRWYRVLDPDAGGAAEGTPEPGKVWVKCEKCKRPQNVEDTPTTWAVVPHTYFVSLPRTVEYLEWLVAGLVLLAVGRQEADAVSVETLVSISGRSRRAIQSALRSLEAKGLVRRVEQRAGAATLYSINIEQFASGVLRPMRRLNRSKSEETAKQKPAKSPQLTDSHEGGGEVEFHPVSADRRLIWCPSCRVLAFGRCITAPVEPPRKPAAPARAVGPPPKSSLEGELTSYLRTWGEQMQRRVPASVVAEVYAILGDDQNRHRAFGARCEERREYIIRRAEGMGVFTGFARDVVDLEKQTAGQGRVISMPTPVCDKCGGRGTKGGPWETIPELQHGIDCGVIELCDCGTGQWSRNLLYD